MTIQSFTTIRGTRNVGSTNQVVVRRRGNGDLEFTVGGRTFRFDKPSDDLTRLFNALVASSGTIS